MDRIRLHLKDMTDYDPGFYRELLIRATESVLSTLGLEELDIQCYLRETHDAGISSSS